MKRFRSALGGAATLVLTASLTFAVSTPAAYASLPGTGDMLTSDGANNNLIFDNGSRVQYPGNAIDPVAWAPDGSAFIGGSKNGLIEIPRSGGAGQSIVGGTQWTRQPAWSDDGTHIYYATTSDEAHYWIAKTPSAPGWPSTRITPNDGYSYTNPDTGPDGILVAGRTNDDLSVQEIVLIDPDTGSVTPIISNASDPSVSPDGTRVAFVRDGDDGNGGFATHIYTSDMHGGDAVQVSFGWDGLSPAWSPDGKEVALLDALGQFSPQIYSVKPDGSLGKSFFPHDKLRGGFFPAYQPYNDGDHVVTLAGAGRFNTAIQISQSHWATAGDAGDTREAAHAVVLSRSDTFADAVSGSALAAGRRGPLLLTPPTSFDTGTQAEIHRVLGDDTSATVYLLGSTKAISQSTEDAIVAMGYQVKRLSGTDRFGTSIAIAKEISAKPDVIMTATGMNFPDALSAGAAAGKYDASGQASAVVVLTNDTTMPKATEDYLDSLRTGTTLNAKLYAIGKQANTALSAAGWKGYGALAGSSRYDTARKVANEFYAGSRTAGVTTGLNWPDALAGGALLGVLDAPLLLTGPSLDVTAAQALSARSGSLNLAYVFGASLPGSLVGQIGSTISGPGGYDTVAPAPLAITSEDLNPADAPKLPGMAAAPTHS